MSNIRKIIYIVLVVYLGVRGYQIFIADKPEPEIIPSTLEEASQETSAFTER